MCAKDRYDVGTVAAHFIYNDNRGIKKIRESMIQYFLEVTETFQGHDRTLISLIPHQICQIIFNFSFLEYLNYSIQRTNRFTFCVSF